MLAQDFPAEGLRFALEHDLETRSFEADVQSTDAGKERGDTNGQGSLRCENRT
jgi:hypothetical protein